MSTTTNLRLHFGVLAPRLASQLADAGLTADEAELEECQDSADKIVILYLRGILTRTEARKARERIGKKLFRAATPDAPQGAER
jgi:hypothetical protein